MFAYVDETGNTGSNLFDPEQPEFLTAALITRTDFDVIYRAGFQKLCKKNGITSIHGSVQGFGTIEDLALPVLRLLKKANARFFVSRVEKRYLLATKVFDVFFDSGENPAVPWTVYNIRPLRLTLAFRVAGLLDDKLARSFWAMLMAKSEAKARAMIPAICEKFLERVQVLPDARTQEIVGAAFTWSRDHPEALDIFISRRQAKNGHMPNMVAFKNLLEGLEQISKRWDRPIRRIVHDRQSQFEGTLAEWHLMAANASSEPVHLPGETHVLQQAAGSSFEVSASEHSPGIQIADLILWLFRQFLNGKEIPPDSGKLLSFAMRKALQSDFSFDGVGRSLEERLHEVMTADLSPEQVTFAQEMLQRTEEVRQRNIALYEEDGLMPYQRGGVFDKATEVASRYLDDVK